MNTSIEFFAGISEELENVSLRMSKSTGIRSVLMSFKTIKALEGLNTYTKEFTNLRLVDEEGEIIVQPNSTKFIFGGDEGDDLKRVECTFELLKDEHWDRFMRFMERYAVDNGMGYGEGRG